MTALYLRGILKYKISRLRRYNESSFPCPSWCWVVGYGGDLRVSPLGRELHQDVIDWCQIQIVVRKILREVCHYRSTAGPGVTLDTLHSGSCLLPLRWSGLGHVSRAETGAQLRFLVKRGSRDHKCCGSLTEKSYPI